MDAAPRGVCPRCRRPGLVCYCAHLLSVPTRTRVVFLQHPREARVPIGTARMTHLMLGNSEIHQGVDFAASRRVQELAADPAAALLFPGEGAVDPELLGPGAVQTLVVIDGTWPQARKVLRQNPILTRLLRIGLASPRPGNYRIRREPAAGCLATIEAVTRVLGVLEGDPERFEALLAPFTFMVDRQIELAAMRSAPPRRWKSRAQKARAEAEWQARLFRAVVVHAEVNAHARTAGVPGRPELLHLVARRLPTGEEFQAIVAPWRPLARCAAHHLGLEEERILLGEPIAAALKRWEAFVRPGDVPCGWGRFTRDLLAAEGVPMGEWLDLRVLVARRLQRSPGTPQQAAQHLLAPAAIHVSGGRAGRTVAELQQIVFALRG